MENRFPDHQIRMRYADADALIFGSLANFYSYNSKGTAFIDLLLRVFEDEQSFNSRDFKNYDLELIMDYVRRTHKFYLHKILPEIEQSIYTLLQDYNDKHPLLPILVSFYSSYKTELIEHINDEENRLLPYIENLMDCNSRKIEPITFYTKVQYSVQNFVDDHHDTAEDISSVRKTIQMYQPPTSNQTPYRVLITQLQLFERDLAIHALIEDQVLIPRAIELERKNAVLFRELIKQN